MDPRDFSVPTFGQPAREPGNRWAFWYFQPSPIPREIALTTQTVRALSDADASLGQLRGLGTLIRNPELLVRPYLTQEALASTRIEGTQASLSDVFQAEAGGSESASDDVAEVGRYIAATHEGYELVRRLPITQRLILQLHRTLISGVRGTEKRPGEIRQTPVWVGSPTDSPDTATFVPPLPAEVPALLSDWEDFVNVPGDLPTLVRCGLMHYQFETIHPFLDGNGRIGRLLINLMLLEEKRLETPLLYLSGYLEQHRREYYERLQAVRERGEMQEWLQFFLTAVRRSADDAVTRAERLVALRERYIAETARSRFHIRNLIDLIFANPYVTVARLQGVTKLSVQGARNVIKNAVGRGWLQPAGNRGRGGRAYWLAGEIFAIIDAPWTYLDRE